MNTCIAEGCPKDIEVKKHSLCRRHYNKLYYYGKLPARDSGMECRQCGARLEGSGRHRVYCSAECRTKASRARDKAAAQARRATERMTRPPRPCAWCNEPLPQASPGQRKFHTECAKEWTSVTRTQDDSGRQCTKPGCDRPLRARGMCSMHYKRWARAEGLVKPEPWDDRRKNNHHLRRARMTGNGPCELVTIDALMARDNNTCNVCDEHIDPTLEYPNPMSKSIDHIIAVSRGGEHTMNNTAPSHLICNIRKNDKPLEEARAQHV